MKSNTKNTSSKHGTRDQNPGLPSSPLSNSEIDPTLKLSGTPPIGYPSGLRQLYLLNRNAVKQYSYFTSCKQWLLEVASLERSALPPRYYTLLNKLNTNSSDRLRKCLLYLGIPTSSSCWPKTLRQK